MGGGRLRKFEAHGQLYMLWFNFILGLNFIFLCFKVMIRRGSTPVSIDSRKSVRFFIINIFLITSNNRRLRSAGDNDRRSKRFRSRCALRKFHVAESQTTREQITSDRRFKLALSNYVHSIRS